MRRLGIADPLLHRLDLVFDMSVGDEDVLPAVVIVVEEKTAEAERDQRGAADVRVRGFIHEQPIAFVVIKRQHLIRKIRNNQTGAAGAVIIRRVNPHASARDTVFAEPDAGGNGALFERSVFLIEVKLIGLRVVGDQDVRPSVVVVIENRDAQSLRRRIVKPGLLRGVFELAVAQVMPEARRRSLVRFGRAVRLVRAIERAIEIGLLRPLHIVRNHEIKFAVAIVIHPSRAGGELVRPPKPGRLSDVSKSSVAIVVEKMALADRSYENVVESVVVVIADGDAESEERNAEPGLTGHVGESAVMIIVVELQRARAVRMMQRGVSRPVLPVDQQNVGPSVVVVIDERAAGTHGFGKPLFAEGSVVVREVNGRLSGDVAEGYGLCRSNDRRGCQQKRHPPRRHGGTEECRKRKVHLFSEPQCLRGGFCLRETHHRCSPGAALAVRRLAGALSKTGSGTDTCSWIFCRSLLSSGLSWRYGPVMAWADSSALKRR